MTVADQLSKLRIVLSRVDRTGTAKVGRTREILAAVESHLRDLNTGKAEEESIAIDALSREVRLHLQVVNTTLSPGGREAKLKVRRVVSHQVDSMGRSQLVGSSGEGGLTFWDDSGDPITALDLEGDMHVPERATIEQRLWRLPVGSGSGCFVFSDSSDSDFAKAVGSQFAPPLANSPASGCEVVDLPSTTKAEFLALFDGSTTRDLLQSFRELGVQLQNFGLVARRLVDADLPTDPAIPHGVAADLEAALSAAGEDEVLQLAAARSAGIWSTSLGPSPNGSYSDFKRFVLSDAVFVVSAPLICYGEAPYEIPGIPKRDPQGPATKSNRLDDGRCYVVDMGGIDPVIRKGKPNPLPPHRYNSHGPDFAFPGQGALKRYKGGKSLGINTTQADQTIVTTWFDGITREVSVPPMTAIWKLDNGSFTFAEQGTVPGAPEKFGGSAGFYTVFSASRPPPAGYMGVPQSPKLHKFGRGKDVEASGATLANGVSASGSPFKRQDSAGRMLRDDGTVTVAEEEAADAGLAGLTGSSNGHGMDLNMLLEELESRGAVKGEGYLTIPPGATSSTGDVVDVLIPAGETVPRITNAVATLVQFANGLSIPDGGPNFFQPGLVPFLGGVPTYTPNWHINFAFYNCGGTESGSNSFQPAVSRDFSSWAKSGRNPSLGPPGPAPVPESAPGSSVVAAVGYNPAAPDTFDPVQMSNGIKGRHCPDYVCSKFPSSVSGRIPVSELPKASETNEDNSLYVTEAPAGARQGWVKFLIVNCPLPVQVDFETCFEDDESVAAILAAFP